MARSFADEEFLTVAEIAGLLKLNQQTIRNWIDQGKLPHVRVGSRRVRILRSDLDAFLHAAEPATKPPEDRSHVTSLWDGEPHPGPWVPGGEGSETS